MQIVSVALGIAVAGFTVESATAAIDNKDVFEGVLDAYQARASGWSTVILKHASWLFWTLVVISLVWTFGMMALRKADIGEFFAEFLRFTIFVGFFWWLLINGPQFAETIVRSLRQMGGEATGLGPALSPSGVADIGFGIFFRIIDHTTVWSPVTSFIGAVLGMGILVLVGLIAANMLVLLCASWILLYAGVFFLGFGGSRWTSDMAINYYKTVLAVASSLFAMVLIIGIGSSIMDSYYSNLSQDVRLKELAVVFIVAVILFLLVDKVPGMVAGIITGARGGGGMGQFGAGVAMGAVGMATAAAATGGSAAMAGAKSTMGGGAALHAAFKEAQQHMATSSGLFSRGANSGSAGGGGLSQAINTGVRFAADMGANLARGAGQVAREKAVDLGNSVKSATSETLGGKIAAAIHSHGFNEKQADETHEFSDDRVGPSATPTDNPEIQAFVEKAQSKHESGK